MSSIARSLDIVFGDKDLPRDTYAIVDMRLTSGISDQSVLIRLEIDCRVCEIPRLIVDGFVDVVRTFHT